MIYCCALIGATIAYLVHHTHDELDLILANNLVMHSNSLTLMMLFCIGTSPVFLQQCKTIRDWACKACKSPPTLETEVSTDSLMDLQMERSHSPQDINLNVKHDSYASWISRIECKCANLIPHTSASSSMPQFSTVNPSHRINKVIINSILLSLIYTECLVGVVYLRQEYFLFYLSITAVGLLGYTIVGRHFVVNIGNI